MFFRKKKNKSGSVSVQVVKKAGRKNVLVKTIGCSSNTFEIEQFCLEAKRFIAASKAQPPLAFFDNEADQWFSEAYTSIKKVHNIT